MRTPQTEHGIPDLVVRPPTDQVVAWRRERLLAAGMDEPTATRLAQDSRTDLHAVLSLIDRGCPPALAARILESSTGTHG